ncbi:hypothetical protein A2662_02450 [Candidatus Giovannonibacteria bacterium RIFCSPHIGHO2_01_FULL_45_33]|nr:MAG: hypothetical protein A2662_02450 [Candidatus Giovannonibacteria bacterium RIFCSPHIGHO2_01_FULL_45_33]OGF71042.1 MAG: hypothetical protein A3C73_00355 [Candidatus Giovannonibacteria bacterium RIFCSPHIGHO2_02_FULL_44_11]
MPEKKKSASWYIAATHWLTSGFVIPFILTFVIALILGLIFGADVTKGASLIALSLIVYMPLIYWLGVMYSARYINKKYFIENKNEIAKLATLYLAIVGGGFRVLQILNGSGLTFEHIGFFLAIIAFYIASKKYIYNTATIDTTPQNSVAGVN